MKWFASEVVTPDSYDLWVDTNPDTAWTMLVCNLRDAKKDAAIVRVTIGTVEAETKDQAVAEIRAGNWQEPTVTVDKLDTEAHA